MSFNRLPLSVLVSALAVPVFLVAEEHVDLSVVHQIRTEALENSKVMDDVFYLSDVYGPRVTSSPGFQQAAEWTVKRLQEYGINARLEKWGPFGRGWNFTHFEAEMIQPQYSPLIGFPLVWTRGTNGAVSGEPILAVLRTEADLEKFKGKLKGKIVLTSAPREIEMITTAPGRRYTDDDLAKQELAPEPGEQPFRRTSSQPAMTREQMRQFRAKVAQFLHDEQPLVVVQEGYTGDGGTVFASAGGSREKKDPEQPPMVALTPEHYNRIARLIEHKIPVKLQFNIQAEFIDKTDDSLERDRRNRGRFEEG